MSSVAELPKAELHLHLEGAVNPAIVAELAPELSREEIDARFRFSGFEGFIECFKWVTSYLRGPEAYALVARRLMSQLANQKVRYAEITLSAGVVIWRELDFEAIYTAVRREAEASPVEVRWILDAVRHFGVDHAWQVAELAVSRVNNGVVAFGIGGSEERGPAGWFGEVFAHCRKYGLRLTAHAGETSTAQSVWDALAIGAERVGHGIRAVHDPALLKHLRDHRIPLEVCLTSNVATRAVPSMSAHPLLELFDAGVPIVLNSDDPGLFGTTLTHEYEIARDQFGFSDQELELLANNAFEFAFAPEPKAAGWPGKSRTIEPPPRPTSARSALAPRRSTCSES